MSPYQKAASLVIRMVGVVLAVMGGLGPLYVAILAALRHATPPYPTERWLGSAVWLLGGLLLVLASKPLGRALGRGLD
jgi:hypothetical protein